MEKTKELKYELDIQTFAGGDTVAPIEDAIPPVVEPTAPVTEPMQLSNTIDYDKIAEAIANRSSAAEESALRGFFKSEGLSDEEVKQAVAEFKTNKKAKENAEQEKLNEIIKQNQNYKEKEKMSLITSNAKEVAEELDVKEDKFDKLMKLSNIDKFTKEDGSVNKEAIKAEFEEQLKDLPEFLNKTKTITITKGKGIDVPPSMSDEEEYRKKKYGNNKYYKGN